MQRWPPVAGSAPAGYGRGAHMDTWIIIAGALGFTLLTMLLGPWMWSSTWTDWRWLGGKDSRAAPAQDAGEHAPEQRPRG